MNAAHDQLRAELEALVADGARRIRRDRGTRARPFAIVGSLDLIGRLACVACAVLVLAWLVGAPAAPWPIAAGIVLACVGLGALLCWRARVLPVGRGDALALWDRAAGLEDRLLAADQFLRQAPAGDPAFVAAALEDAAAHVARARGARLASPRAGVAYRGPALRGALGLGALLLVALLPPRAPSEPAAGDDEVAAATTGGELLVAEQSAPSIEPPPAEVPESEPRERVTRTPTAAGASAQADEGAVSDRIKESLGKTGQGKSADASASSKASQARGAPSGQSQTSKGTATEPKDQKKKAPKPSPPTDPGKPKPDEETSGSTAGQGSAKGSSKNPAATDWSSKDHVSTPDDAEIEDDEETQDEEEEQESRGGIQLSLRDRRPPVSRDLRIGFGNRPNPDANGRGGPSAPKKSRGVASLVLGVPIPDRVKGQPNAGKTKITQERIEPREEEPVLADAGARGERSGPLGRLGRLEMTPWMRQLVRNYFLARRAEEDR